ncbi:2,3,4,5-tetrahydropyridine-2,6-dicarboxylate N-succinyltransferase [Microbacterium soli]
MSEAEKSRLEERIEVLWENPGSEAEDAVSEVVSGLDAGVYRCAEQVDGAWRVNTWVKKALAMHFRTQPVVTARFGPWTVRDRFALKQDAEEGGYRVAPSGAARHGSYVAPGATLMPSFVNLGCRVGEGTLVDTWVSLGTCAQIGDRVTLLPNTSIVGALHPIDALPAIVEDDCWVGSGAVIGAGVLVRTRAVVGHGTVIGAGQPIVDVTEGAPRVLDHVPADAIVINAAVDTGSGSSAPVRPAVVGYRRAGEPAHEALERVMRLPSA